MLSFFQMDVGGEGVGNSEPKYKRARKKCWTSVGGEYSRLKMTIESVLEGVLGSEIWVLSYDQCLKFGLRG